MPLPVSCREFLHERHGNRTEHYRQRQGAVSHCVEFAQRVEALAARPRSSKASLSEKMSRRYGLTTPSSSRSDAYISPGPVLSKCRGRWTKLKASLILLASSPKGGRRPISSDGEGTKTDFARCIAAARSCSSRHREPAARRERQGRRRRSPTYASPHEYLHEMCISPSGAARPDIFAVMPATVACTILLADGAALRAKLKSAALAVAPCRVDTAGAKLADPCPPISTQPGAKDGPPSRCSQAIHEHLVLRVMDNGLSQRHHVGGGAASRRAATKDGGPAARLLLVRPFAWALFPARPGISTTISRGSRRALCRACEWSIRQAASAPRWLTENGVTTPLVGARQGTRRGPKPSRTTLANALRARATSPFRGVGHPLDVMGHIASAAEPLEDAQFAGLVVAHAPRPPRQIRRYIPGARTRASGRPHSLAAQDRPRLLPLDCARAHAAISSPNCASLAGKLGESVAIGGLVKAARVAPSQCGIWLPRTAASMTRPARRHQRGANSRLACLEWKPSSCTKLNDYTA